MRRDDARTKALTHRIAALLLEYPTAELVSQVPDLRAIAPTRAFDPLLDHLTQTPLTALTAEYVDTFDLRRKICLYLTYYAYGDTRERGMALLAFKRTFRAAGLEIDAEELLRLALVDRASPWAGVLAAVCSTLPPLKGDEREAVARLAAEGPPGEQVGLEPYGTMAGMPR